MKKFLVVTSLGLEEINNTSSFSESKWLRFLILLLGVYGLVLLV